MEAWIAKDSDLLTMSTIIGDSNHISIKTLMEETKIDKRFLVRMERKSSIG